MSQPLSSVTSSDLPERQDHWFLEQVQPHEPKLRNWLRRRFPWLTDVDDLIHDAYAKILRAHREGRIDGETRSYLFQTAKNAAFDLARRNRIVAFDSVAEMDRLPVAEEAPGSAETLSREHELRILANAIESLPDRCRTIVQLQKFRGLSYREIAAQLGISENTVSVQVQKAMRLCRDYLQAHGVGPR